MYSRFLVLILALLVSLSLLASASPLPAESAVVKRFKQAEVKRGVKVERDPAVGPYAVKRAPEPKKSKG